MTDNSNSPLASLFKPYTNAWASWSKLVDGDEFSQLHSKFWGEKIEDEAQDWRISHPDVKDDDDDDITSGCYALHLGVDLIVAKLWVRKDYIRIYDYCNERYTKSLTAKIPKARSVVITGQPGIGKTFWITYAARRRLGEQKPFLWYQDSVCYLFVEDGVFQHAIGDVNFRDFKRPFLWAFVDADPLSTGIPQQFAGTEACLYVMFTSSPKKERWKPLTKSSLTATVIMNPWSLEEIRQAAKHYGFTKEQKCRAEDVFKYYGPTPRLCLDFVDDPALLRCYGNHLGEVASHLTTHSLRHFVQRDRDSDVDAESHTLFIVRRNKVEDLEKAYLAPISANVEMLLMTVMDTLQRLEQVDLYRNLASVSSARGLAGIMYEILCQTHLQEGIELKLKPMITRGKLQTYFHWRSQVVEQTSSSMVVDDSGDSVTFPANIPIVYKGAPTSIEANRLYVPRARNQVGFDSFFKLGQTLYVFQVNMASEHSIKEGMVGTLFGLRGMLPPEANWRFVFITPGGNLDVKAKATSKEVKGFFDGLELYSADLEFM